MTMEPLHLDASQRTPLVAFDFAGGRFLMKGEIYPEDASSFFAPLLESLHSHISQPGRAPDITFDFELIYFNSSSAKGLMNIFRMLEEAAETGATVVVNWHYQEDDDTILEAGEDFAEDLSAARFRFCPREAA